jgi:hypothetical protein
MMFSKSTVAAVLSLVASVHGDNHVGEGKPAMMVGYKPLTDVRDQVCDDHDDDDFFSRSVCPLFGVKTKHDDNGVGHEDQCYSRFSNSATQSYLSTIHPCFFVYIIVPHRLGSKSD